MFNRLLKDLADLPDEVFIKLLQEQGLVLVSKPSNLHTFGEANKHDADNRLTEHK